MHLFVTGASGFVGTAVVAELVAAGHQVVGLARSQASAARLTANGADVHRASLDDLDSIYAAAAAADGVLHLAYRHGAVSEEAARTDLRVVETIGAALAGSQCPFVLTSGTLVLAPGHVAVAQVPLLSGHRPMLASQADRPGGGGWLKTQGQERRRGAKTAGATREVYEWSHGGDNAWMGRNVTSRGEGWSPEAVDIHGEEVAALRAAITLSQLRLHYQPKVDVSSGRMQGVEALVRWEHPTRGLVPPVEFISLAEDSGLIGSLGEWVLTESCLQQATWAVHLGENAPPMVCVNVSAHQFVPGFVDLVRHTIASTGVLPEMVGVEITESVVMGDVGAAVGIMHELKALGLVLSIDDFGTGYSSLSQLKRFPIDELKIDKSFIDGLGSDPGDTAIVAAIVAMAHALGLLVIAEGVETIDQLTRLRNLGCDMAQGYLFSRPLPPEGLVALGTVLRPVAEGDAAPAPTPAAEVVLIVDDTADVRQLANVSLATSGFAVLEAVSGQEALREARRVRPACIVLDVSMPGMDGFETCRALRSDPSISSTAIVMLTARADAHDKVKAFSAGADDYMVKPFAPRELASRVRQAIARRSAAT